MCMCLCGARTKLPLMLMDDGFVCMCELRGHAYHHYTDKATDFDRMHLCCIDSLCVCRIVGGWVYVCVYVGGGGACVSVSVVYTLVGW